LGDKDNSEILTAERDEVVTLNGIPFILEKGTSLRGTKDNWDLAHQSGVIE
jgi:hypothetical protein